DRWLVSDIASADEGGGAFLPQQLLGLLRVGVAFPIADRDRRSTPGEREADRSADAARPAGDDGDSSFEIPHAARATIEIFVPPLAMALTMNVAPATGCSRPLTLTAHSGSGSQKP